VDEAILLGQLYLVGKPDFDLSGVDAKQRSVDMPHHRLLAEASRNPGPEIRILWLELTAHVDKGNKMLVCCLN
jgi:hypothetical protein